MEQGFTADPVEGINEILLPQFPVVRGERPEAEVLDRDVRAEE